jgi:DNA topoisomerase I
MAAPNPILNPVTMAVPDEVKSARIAGLRYRIPKGPGIQRKNDNGTTSYLGPDGQPIEDEETLARIRALVIPPAWTSVWISPDPNGHIQAIGRDARGRKQYRYHPEYRKVRDLIKFDRMRVFGRVLPRIRRAVERDLSKKGMPKRKVLAAVVKLLETTYIRVGNEEYAEDNGSFGLTTMRNKHVEVLGDMLKFKFKGKSGQHHEITLHDKRLVRIVKSCRDIPGSSLFEYLDEEGQPQTIDSGDVNEYLKEISGGDFTAKDFRTWGGTCLAASCLLERCALQEPDQSTKQALIDVVKEVASKLGNKPATCKKYYIHPTLMECYSAGQLRDFADKYREGQSAYSYERIVLGLLTPLKRARAKAA